jgi:hypothetical protein
VVGDDVVGDDVVDEDFGFLAFFVLPAVVRLSVVVMPLSAGAVLGAVDGIDGSAGIGMLVVALGSGCWTGTGAGAVGDPVVGLDGAGVVCASAAVDKVRAAVPANINNFIVALPNRPGGAGSREKQRMGAASAPRLAAGFVPSVRHA